MMTGVEGVRKSIHQSWLAKGLGLGLICWGFKGVQEEIPLEEASTLQISSVAFPPVHNSILVTDYLTKMGIKTIPQPLYSPDLTPCDFWLFPKLRGCRYETIENKCIAAGGDYFEVDLSFMRVLSIKVPIRKSLETYCMHLVNK